MTGLSPEDQATVDEFKAKRDALRAARPKGTHLYEAGQTTVCIHCAGISLTSVIVMDDPPASAGLFYTGGPENYARRLPKQYEQEWIAECARMGWSVCECGPLGPREGAES